MTEQERQQAEIERLQRKLQRLSEAYSRTTEELQKIKEQKKEKVKRGRPAVNAQTKAQTLSLCSQGHTMREIAAQTGLSLGAVHKIITGASEEARCVYVYMDREKPATLIDVNALTRKVKIINFTEDMLSRAFGINEKPNWENYEDFLESRCMPRTRYGIREELRYMGLDVYDPVQIIAETSGRVYGDGQWLRRMDKAFTKEYDVVFKEETDREQQRKRLQELLVRKGCD